MIRTARIAQIALCCVLFCLLSALPARARSISINLYNSSASPTGNHQLEAGETAGWVPVAGEHWNNVRFSFGNLSGTAAQRDVEVADDQGQPAAARFESTLGSAYVGNSGAGASDGNGSLMRSYLSFDDPHDGVSPNDSGHLRISGLGSAFTTPGYQVIVYFDTDNANRTHTFTLSPDGGTALTRAGDDSGTYAGTLVEAVGAGTYANTAIFSGLTATNVTLTVDSSAGRGAVNGIQIVSNDHPAPPEILSFTTDQHYVAPGAEVTLSWETSNAMALAILPGPGDITAGSPSGAGSTAIVVNATTEYTLSASNEAGVVTATLRVGAGPPRPNILMFLVDDMGWQDTSEPFHYDDSGTLIVSALNQRYITPNMELLADRGMKFSNAYAMPVCTPSRACLMTGMNSARHHITNWTSVSGSGTGGAASPPDWRKTGMDETDIPLPRLLTEAGYRTIHAGKAHFGSGGYWGADPHNLGFDVNIAGNQIGHPASYYGTANFGSGSNHVPGLDDYHGQDIFLTEALTLEINQAIEQAVNDGVPFLAYMAHYAVHAPFQTDPRFSANYPGLSGSELAYATLIEGMDKSLGDILAQLTNLGVAEDTLVIFMSDNGGDAPIANNLDRPIISGNAPLRGKKGMRYEGGIRVPMIAAWAQPDPTNDFQVGLPIPAGSVEHDLVTIFDLFPTLLGVAGVSFSHAVDGMDLRPYLTATPGVHRPQELTIHFPHDHNNDHYSIRLEGDWKLIYNTLRRRYELFDLSVDIGESTNRVSDLPDRTMSMARHMARDLQEMGAQFTINTTTQTPIPPTMPNLQSVDLDEDGIPDLTEDANSNGLIDPGETDPDNDNSDGDGTPDGAELQVGTDPLDPDDFFGLSLTTDPGESGLVLNWPTIVGPTTFRVDVSTNLLGWALVADDIPAAGSGDSTSYPLGDPPDVFRSYRVMIR